MVECRACAGIWIGQEQLTGLGEHIGANIDWAALFEMGANVPSKASLKMVRL